jgi:membrane protease YdiL (CAAX protease family)
MKDKLKIIRFFIAFLVFYFTATLVVIVMRYGMGMSLSSDNIYDLVLIDVISSLISMIIVVLMYNDKIRDSIKKVNKMKIRNFILKVIVSGICLFAVKIVSGIVISILTSILGLESTTVENQSLVESMLESAPFIMMISVSIFAPLTEELIFRAGIKDIFKNKKVFIAVSGLIFGLMHVTDSVLFLFEILLLGVVIDKLLNDKVLDKSLKVTLSVITSIALLIIFGYVYLLEYGNLITKIMSLDMVEVVGSIAYIAMGVYLAYIYSEDENILCTIGIHAFNNFVSVLLIM